MMIRRIALVSSLAVMSAFTLVTKANAADATQDIFFDGTIGSVCQFSTPSNGTIAQFSPTSEYLEAAGGFSSTSGIGTSVGTAGKITVNCTAGGSVTVAAPVEVSVPTGFTSSNLSAFADNGTTATRVGLNFTVGSTSALTIPTSTNVDLNIGLSVGNKAGNALGVPAGSYSYRVTVTAAPN